MFHTPEIPEKEYKCSYLVVKVASRCNLNCTYCYMYNLGDQSYLKQPKKMSEEVVDALMQRVLTHCKGKDTNNFVFSFHGGEPLLAGKEFFRMFTGKAKAALEPAGITPLFNMQTNAVLITDDWCRLFEELHIGIGLSLDGYKEVNDAHRIDHKGNGSYDRIVKGMKKAVGFPQLKQNVGVLSVININADPIKLYEHFVELGIPSFDLLLPAANYDQPPPTPDDYRWLSQETPFADWLIPMFNRWFDDKRPERPRIRLFNGIVLQLLGAWGATDAIGSNHIEVLVVETDGGIEAVDTLKMCGDGFTKEGANVLTHEFEDAFQNDLIRLYEKSHQALCTKCLNCPVKDICGSGYLPHRYSSENGFNNPTVYCKDLMKLITHIQNRVFALLPESFLEKMDLRAMTYAEALAYTEASEAFLPSSYDQELESFRKPAPVTSCAGESLATY
jgi:uncharacterized protein